MSAIVPVVLFAYRRPDLLERTLASLRANEVPLVYAYSDGPRDVSLSADVAEVRRLLRRVDWTRLELVEQPVNVGVAGSELGGISRVLSEHEEVVAVEEDLEFGPGTYAFLCAALERYRDDPRAMGVTAYNHPRVTPPDVVSDPYFCGRMSGLMWGTWRRAWSGVAEHTAAEFAARCAAQGIDVTRYGDDLFESVVHEEEHGMWDLRFNLHMLAQRGLFLWPARSMVAHTGYEPRATNSPNAAGWEDSPLPAPPVESIRWPEVREHPGSAELWRRAVNASPPTSFLGRVRRRLARLWPTRP
ncbi:MAG: glycosyltransferase family 2 protein [Gemmatimonadales bacterium]